MRSSILMGAMLRFKFVVSPGAEAVPVRELVVVDVKLLKCLLTGRPCGAVDPAEFSVPVDVSVNDDSEAFVRSTPTRAGGRAFRGVVVDACGLKFFNRSARRTDKILLSLSERWGEAWHVLRTKSMGYLVISTSVSATIAATVHVSRKKNNKERVQGKKKKQTCGECGLALTSK